MSLKNASVVLTIVIDGALALPGSYEYREKTTSGNILAENQRLFIIRKSKNCDCYKRVTLGESFVNYAISDDARPDKEGGFKAFKAHTYWKKMDDVQRLNYHVAKYASDMGAINYTFLINEA
jgi:hypothetical protein